MYLPADQQLIDRETGVSSFRTLIDPERFLRWFNQLTNGSSWQSARLTYLRYKPNQSCLAGYVVQSKHEEQFIHATGYSAELTHKTDKAELLPNISGPESPGALIDPDMGVAVYQFPYDRKLRPLRRVVDPKLLARMLRRLSIRTKTRSIAFEHLVYKPQRRFVGKVNISGEPKASLKIYAKTDFDAILHRANRTSSGSLFQAPRVFGASLRHQAIAYEWLPGQPLADVILNGSADRLISVTRKVGRGLAEMHAGHPSFRQTTPHDDVSLIQERAAYTRWLLPNMASRLEGLIERLTAGLFSMPVMSFPSHGDFYAKQILIHDDGIGLIDFDEAVNADPARDLGNFIAHLGSWAVRRQIPDDLVSPVSSALFDGYTEAADHDPDLADRTAVYEGAAWMKLASHCFRHRLPGWDRLIDQMLRRAGRCLNSTIKQCSPHIPQPSHGNPAATDLMKQSHGLACASEDPLCEILAKACDPGAMQSKLNHLDLEHSYCLQPMTLTGLHVIRHKPGRRCLIEYQLETPAGHTNPERKAILGKVRRKGVDYKTYQLAKQLRASGMDGRNEYGVYVPRPLGVISDLSMWCQEKVPGRSAFELLKVSEITTLAKQAAQAIFNLHQSGLQVNRWHGVNDELSILSKRYGQMTVYRPELATRLAGVLEGCRELGRGLGIDDRMLIHRDFYPDHLIVDGSNVAIIDFDLASMGDPAIDVGNFIAHLMEWGLRHPHQRAQAEAMAEAFERAYSNNVDTPTRHRIRGYTLLSLARLVEISARLPSREHTVLTLLTMCERCLMSHIYNGPVLSNH